MFYSPSINPPQEVSGRLKHVNGQILPIERILRRVKQVSHDNGAVHYYAARQMDRIGHDSIHNWIWKGGWGGGKGGGGGEERKVTTAV